MVEPAKTGPAFRGLAVEFDSQVWISPHRAYSYWRVVYRLDAERPPGHFLYEHLGPGPVEEIDWLALCREHAAGKVRSVGR